MGGEVELLLEHMDRRRRRLHLPFLTPAALARFSEDPAVQDLLDNDTVAEPVKTRIKDLRQIRPR